VYGNGSGPNGTVPFYPNGLLNPNNNKLIINGGDVDGSAYGGAATSSGNATATGNSVTINGGYVFNGNGVYGGGAQSTGDGATLVSGNSVTINGGKVDSTIYGGGAQSQGTGSATASGNSVTINDGMVFFVRGGAAMSSFDPATASGNSVIINDGMAGDIVGGMALNYYGLAAATGNSVTVTGGTVDNVFGGGSDSILGSTEATGNTVTISGGTIVGGVWGGRAISRPGTALATGNSVFISDGVISGNVYGGQAYSDSGAALATNNRVFISGGTVSGIVFGGFSSDTATHNSVTISGAPDLSAARLVGGRTNTGSGDTFTGNTLNVWNYSGTSVNSAQKFQFFNFAFPTSQIGPVLSVNGSAILYDLGGGMGSSIVTASTIGGTAPLQPGDNVTLIETTAALYHVGFTQTQATGQHGATLSYKWSLSTTGTQLTATLDEVGANPQAKSLSEANLAGIALANQTGDFVAGQGLRWARESSGKGFGAFGGISGGKLRHDTGSHVDVSGVSLIAGLSWGTDLTPGRLTLGGFFEYGDGSYDTYNSFRNAANVKGKGDVDHIGGGVLGRLDFAGTGSGHPYAEGSLRVGKVSNDYKSSDLLDGMGREAKFDSSSTYFSVHLGGGYVLKFTDKASLDLHGKYFWTRQGGDTVTLSTDDEVKFKAVDSHRARLGTRFAYAVSETASPYAGLAYEHEFGGKARATAYGRSIDAPELKGGTGIAEFGVTLKPSKNLPLSLDLGVQGYVGQREGVTGSLQIKYAF
jgi:outer membrane autotransporter protein